MMCLYLLLSMQPTKKTKTPKRLSTSIKMDPIHPSDFFRFSMPTSCEDCTHFDSSKIQCTLGYDCQWHLKAYQEKCYELTGKMALCRFLEID
ncbi:MAG: hypothetical protein LW875_00135 [Proteobacteria bacterium]|nr:hypothetical protein [Pseudomonadota bacterium]